MRIAPVVLACLILAPALAASQGVTFTSPPADTPSYGQVEIAVQIDPGLAVRTVTFYADSRAIGTVAAPPYHATASVGDDNVEHTYRAVVAVTSGSPIEIVLKTPKLRIDQAVTFELQQLYVTASIEGMRILDLTGDDFEVYDDGTKQELHAFARGDVPLTAVVLLDASVSMTGEREAAAVAGAKTFFAGMRTLDEGQLMVYSDRTMLSTPLTNVPEMLTAGLTGIESRGGTALYDHLYLAMQQLEARQGRRVVVLLSDGVDSHSVLTAEDVLAKARQSQALLYWVRLHDQPNEPADKLPNLYSAWHNSKDYRQQFGVLGDTVRESGGREIVVHEIAGIEPAFGEVMKELREQYVLGYYPKITHGPGTWHRVKVNVSRSGVKVHSREGYLERR
jgi:Ca-activated chloride channel homolog